MYGRTAALGLLCNPVMKMISVFSFFQLMEHRWNETDRRKPKYSGKHLSQCHFFHHKSHTDWPGIESGLRDERLATNRLSPGTAFSKHLTSTS
jgi:hypothetical protein